MIHFTIPYYTIRYYTILYYTIRYYTIVYYNVLVYSPLQGALREPGRHAARDGRLPLQGPGAAVLLAEGLSLLPVRNLRMAVGSKRQAAAGLGGSSGRRRIRNARRGSAVAGAGTASPDQRRDDQRRLGDCGLGHQPSQGGCLLDPPRPQ